MMTSYLCIVSTETISQNHGSLLLHLVWLGLVAVALEVDPLVHVRVPEDVVASSDPLLETETLEQRHQPAEGDVCVRPAVKDLLEQTIVLGHAAILAL